MATIHAALIRCNPVPERLYGSSFLVHSASEFKQLEEKVSLYSRGEQP